MAWPDKKTWLVPCPQCNASGVLCSSCDSKRFVTKERAKEIEENLED